MILERRASVLPLVVDRGITDPIMEVITIPDMPIPDIITTREGTIIVPTIGTTTITIIIVGIIGGTIGTIGINRRSESGTSAPARS